MFHLMGAIGAFGFFVATHVFVYRSGILKPNPSLLLLFSGFWLGLCLLFINFFPSDPSFGRSSVALYLLLCLAYVMEYTVVELESPSMRIIHHVGSKKEGVVTKDELREIFTDEEMILSRLRDLVDHGFVRFDGLRYHLTAKGTLIARCFALYRNFIRKGMGG